jgi:hypothetical protein
LNAPDLDANAQQRLGKLKTAMTALHQFATGASGTAKTGGATATKRTGVAGQTNNASSTQGTDTAGTGPAGGKEVAGAGQQGGDAAFAGLKAAFPKQQDQALKNMLSAINQAGYQIVKK